MRLVPLIDPRLIESGLARTFAFCLAQDSYMSAIGIGGYNKRLSYFSSDQDWGRTNLTASAEPSGTALTYENYIILSLVGKRVSYFGKLMNMFAVESTHP